MNILKQGKLPKPIYFMCQTCGAQFTCFATEDCVDVFFDSEDTNKPMWYCDCPTDGCQNVCTADFSEEDAKKWNDNLDPKEILVPTLLASTHIDGCPHDGGETVCPHCDARHSDYRVPYLRRSDRFDGAIVCDNCHKPFKLVGQHCI